MMPTTFMTRAIAAAGFVLLTAGAATAGPPLICHPFDPGGARVLPWGDGRGWNTPLPSYDVHRLVGDTMALLSPDAPVLSRMENLRRATIYASRDPRVAQQLLTMVLARAVTSAASGSRDPLAWFDAGYLVESYRQATAIAKWNMLTGAAAARWTLRDEPQHVDGYLLVQKALEVAGSNPEMEFAASLMKEGATSAEHRRRAMAGAREGSLLAKNLAR